MDGLLKARRNAGIDLFQLLNPGLVMCNRRVTAVQASFQPVAFLLPTAMDDIEFADAVFDTELLQDLWVSRCDRSHLVSRNLGVRQIGHCSVRQIALPHLMNEVGLATNRLPLERIQAARRGIEELHKFRPAITLPFNAADPLVQDPVTLEIYQVHFDFAHCLGPGFDFDTLSQFYPAPTTFQIEEFNPGP